MAQKKISAALMPVNCESLSITTIPSSASAGNARCWACPDPRSTTGRQRCVNRRCGSWPGSTLCIWRIPAAAAAGWWIIWPEKGSQSAVTGCETSCDAWVYGRSTRNRAPLFQDLPLSGFPAWWTSNRSPGWIRSGRPTSPTSRYRKDSSTWWRSWICFPETCSAGSSPTALTRSSVSMPWRWRWNVAAGQRSSTPTRVVSSPLVTSWPGCKLRRSRSAGQAGSAATTTSWWKGCGAPSNMRRSIYVPTAMAGKQRPAWLASCGGIAM